MNWIQILAEISAAKATQKEVADFCGCSQSTISELSRGEIKEPAHSLGEKLLAFHSQCVGAHPNRRHTDNKN